MDILKASSKLLLEADFTPKQRRGAALVVRDAAKDLKKTVDKMAKETDPDKMAKLIVEFRKGVAGVETWASDLAKP